MLSNRLLPVCLATLLCASTAFSQAGTSNTLEICDNGLDDDGDGYVDCYDSDCQCFTGADCSVKELPFDFKTRLAWQSTQNGPFITATPVVANMNPQQDSIPEIMVGAAGTSGFNNPNRILFFRGDGSNAANPMALTVPGGFNPYPVPGPTIGDINHDGIPELIISCNDNRIRVFTNYTENPAAPMSLWITSSGTLDYPDQRPFLADFDGDGIPEIYAGSDIFQFNFSNPASPSLNKVINGGAYVGRAMYNSYQEGSCNPTAADLLSVADCNGDPDCAGLELIAGPVIYSIDLDPTDGDGIQIKVKRDLNQLAPGSAYSDGYTAVADVDLDGILDVVVSAKRGNNQMGVYAWNKNGLLQFFPYPNGSIRSGSLACIANFYDDRTAGFTQDLPEIVVCNAYNLNCFNLQAAKANPAAPYWWSLDTKDYSGFTGSSVYDFNGDGFFELVYRDEDNLRILYGGAAPFPPGVDNERNWFKTPCGSLTADEYPVVADVDNDGETEITVTGYTFSGYNSPASDYRGRLRVFESAADPWMPCRNVWNQYNYFVVNVNDDLSIPAQQQLHHLEFPAPGSNNRPLNRYLSQRPLFNEDFQPFLPVPDALATVTDVRCANDALLVQLSICNKGSKTLPAGTPVAFYGSDPTSTNALLIDATQTTDADVAIDSCRPFVFKIPQAAGTLFGVVNDNGSHPRPFDLETDFPVTTQFECNWPNNIFSFETDYPILQIDTINGDCFGNPGSAVATATSAYLPLVFQWSGAAEGPEISGVPDGIYTVTATDARGCASMDSTWVQAGASVQAEVQLTAILCYGQTGNASAVVSDGTQDIDFLWSNNATTPEIHDLAAGNYALTLTYADGKCAQVFDFQLIEPEPLLSEGIAVTAACPGEMNGSLAFLGAAQGTPPYSQLWSTGSMMADLSALAPGAYALTITDANGCTLMETVEVPEFEAPVLTASAYHVSCFGANDGSISTQIIGGSPGFTYTWSNQMTTPDIQNLAPGSYALQLFYADGKCAEEYGIQIQEPPLLQSLGTTATAACPGAANGTASFLGAAQGTPPYNLQWSVGSVQADLSGLATGVYLLTITDAHGCTLTDSASVGEYPALALNAAIQEPLCAGGTDGAIDLQPAAGTAPYGFLWSNGQKTEDLMQLVAGAYTVTVTDAHSCTQTYQVTLSQPTALLSSGIAAAPACPGEANGSVNFLGATQGTPPYSLLWSTGSAAPGLSGLTAGDYQLTVTDAHGCTVADTAIVGEHPAPLLSASTQEPLCAGGSDGWIALHPESGTPPYAFLWSNGQGGADLAQLAAGNYAVTATDANNCTQTLQVTLAQPETLASNGTTVSPACAGEANGSATFLGAAQGTPPYNLLWSTGSAATGQPGLPAGMYTLTVSDAHGCTLLDTALVPEYAALLLSAVTANPQCHGGNDGSIDLNISGGTAPYAFLWSNGQNQEDPIALPAGNYSLTATDAAGCTQVTSFDLTAPDSLQLQAQVKADTCVSSDGSIAVTASGGTGPYAFAWSTGSSQGSVLSGLSAGSYSVTLTDAHGCVQILSMEVPAYGAIPLLDAYSDTLTCARPVVPIGVSADQNNLHYVWHGPSGTFTDQAMQTVAVAGTYSVTVTNSQGCTATAQLTVPEDRVAPLADAGAASVEAPCGTGSVLLDASASSAGPGFLNRWQGTSGGAIVLDTAAILVAVAQPGWYVHIVQNLSNGCQAVDSVKVSWEAPIAANLLLDSISCFGEDDGTIRLKNISGGSPPYLFSIDNQNFTTGSSFYNLGPGQYSVSIRDTFGCLWQAEVVLKEPPELTVHLLASDTVIERGQFVHLQAVPFPPGAVLSGMVWQPAGFDFVPMALRQTVRPLESTEFSVQIFDLRGCPASDRVFIRVDNFQIYVPNVIYPGRFRNDAFTIFAGDGVEEIRLMRIYDRWGSLVFENRHFAPNELRSGWPGTYRGEEVNPGVFVWYAEILLRDGQVRLLKGDVTVVR